MFTQNWNEELTNVLEKIYPINPVEPMVCVEIGSFEGKGSIKIIEKMCVNPNSLLYCVDPWEDKYVNNELFSNLDHYFIGQYERFKNNTKGIHKIIELRGQSDFVIDKIEHLVDFAFIDGDHSEKQVYKDGVMMFEKMRNGGIMVFNDYGWIHNGENCGKGIDRFLEEYKDNIDILYKKYNVAVRVKKPVKFHVYALNWNEEKLLPKFFKYYEQAEKIYVYDNESNDESLNIIKKYNRNAITFSTNNKFDDLENINIKNTCWKQSKNVDYVIVQDLDEFLFFPNHPNDVLAGLQEIFNHGFTIIKPKSYHMFCSDEEFDSILEDQYISTSVTNGSNKLEQGFYDKCICFDPFKIESINYTPGAHKINPSGLVKINFNVAFLLHYKYIGKKYLKDRHTIMGKRLSENNINNGYGVQYLENSDKIINKYYDLYSSENIFREMYPNTNFASISFNGKKCVIDTFGESDIISKNLLLGKIWEPKVANWIKTNSNENITFIDIGCNIGTHICISKLSGMGKIYGIECNSRTYSKINNTVNVNGWKNIELFNVAVSDCKKEVGFIKVIGNIGASYIEETHIGWNGTTEKIGTVSCDTLNNILPNSKLNTEHEIIIKMDIEGHELNALMGMNDILNYDKTKQIIIELNPSTTSYLKLKETIEYIISKNYTKIKLLFNTKNDEWCGDEFHSVEYSDITIEELNEALKNNYIVEVVFIKF